MAWTSDCPGASRRVGPTPPRRTLMVERPGRVEGKAAIVTGAGSTPGPGIGTGKAIAIALAREGAKVLLVDIHLERAEETLGMIEAEGGTAMVFGGDVRIAAD